MPLIDSFNRTIDYLRVSVTDRCNFRCVYCMPEEGAPVAPKADILTFEEIVRIVRIASELGIKKVRLTGGEPLVRRDIVQLVTMIGQIPSICDLSLTTNGFQLARYAAEFTQGGLNRVNISLDTLRPDRFIKIARRGNLQSVLDGIDSAIQTGLAPVKINCVVMRGWNEDELNDFVEMTLSRPINVRFIELMPINWSKGDDSVADGTLDDLFALAAPADYKRNGNITLYSNEQFASFRDVFHNSYSTEQTGQLDALAMRKAFISTEEMTRQIETKYSTLQPVEVTTNGPARSYKVSGATGTVGFISQITNDMCANCNRLRLTADGQLRPCLMADGEVDLREALRRGASDEDIADLFRLTVLHKPKEHRLEDGKMPIGRNMSQLGG